MRKIGLLLNRVFVVCACLYITNVSAQGYYAVGSRSMAMGNSSVTFSDAWSYFNNPAGYASLEAAQVGLSYENRFLLKELQSQAIAAGIPLKFGCISIGAQTFGYRQFRSTKAGVGYSMKLTDHLLAGVQLNYQGVQLNENYGNKNTVSADLGVIIPISEKWRIGTSIINLGRAKLSDYQDDRFTTAIRLGTSYRFSKLVTITTEAEKDLDYPVRVKAGVEYQPIEHLYLRGGFTTSRAEYSFGLGYDFGLVQLDLGSSYDTTLGWSPNFSLIVDWNKN